MGEWTVRSPNGTSAITVALGDDGFLIYGVEAFGSKVIESSALGVRRADTDLVAGLRFVGASDVEIVDEPYALFHGKAVSGRLRAQLQTLTFANGDGLHLELDLVAADDGVAFRYRMPDGPDIATVLEEATTFSLAADGRAWIQATQPADYFAPAYENLYSNGVPIGLAAPVPSWNMPALFELDGVWVLLAESDLGDDYVGGHLSNHRTGRTYRMVLPQVAEGLGVGDREPRSSVPWELPWRVILVGRTPADVANSDFVNALAAPPSGDYSWIRPGRVAWSWWSDHASPRDLDSLRRFVDFAAEMGWEHTLVDANWNVHDDAAVAELVAYAAERGVGTFFWYNSGGPNNAVTEQPRDRMFDPDTRRAEMDKLADWGVAGIKVDFFHSDKQAGIELYLGILRDAADRQIMVNFHGSTVPRGWSRTWPHLMTMEGVAGAEQYDFRADYPEAAPWHNTVLAFTRNVIGPMDYTPVTFSDVQFPHVTTNAHELALAVVFESGLQHFADSATSYRAQSSAVQRFLRDVPAVWEETRFLDGTPGSHVVVARRAGASWYVGAINGTDQPVRVAIPDTFVGEGVSLFRDDGPRRIEVEAVEGALEIELAPFGGAVVAP